MTLGDGDDYKPCRWGVWQPLLKRSREMRLRRRLGTGHGGGRREVAAQDGVQHAGDFVDRGITDVGDSGAIVAIPLGLQQFAHGPGDLREVVDRLASGQDLERAERYLRRYLAAEPEGNAPTLAEARGKPRQVVEKAKALNAMRVTPGPG